MYTVALLSCLVAAVSAQQPGPLTPEVHPSLTYSLCTTDGGCTSHAGGVTLDANYRWAHNMTGYTNCQGASGWDPSFCPDPVTCSLNCVLEGVDYNATYGVTTADDALTLKYISSTGGVGSRVYLLSDNSTYQIFKLKNQEFTFDVDVSMLPCGVNGALYFSEMPADGGTSMYPNNKAGATYGTGYCDAQCPSDIKFIEGEANIPGYGACCSEMDIWEANSMATAYTPHPCTKPTTRCMGLECGNGSDRYNGICDKDGCDFNSYRMGDTSYYGPGLTVDTTLPVTVVTQFLTSDNTATGTLTEIRRLYVQNGTVIQNSKVDIPGVDAVDSITDGFCAEQKTAFNNTNAFADKGGLAGMGDAFDRGMVLVMSLWDDAGAHMLWLDSTYPVDAAPGTPGTARGPCSTDSGDPTVVRVESADSKVVFSNIKLGDIGTTYSW